MEIIGIIKAINSEFQVYFTERKVDDMDLTKYISDETTIETIKNEYLDGNLSMKDMLNGTYSGLPIEDKVNLICWSDDYDKFEVLKDGIVVDK